MILFACEFLEGRVTSYSNEIKIMWGSDKHIITTHLLTVT